MDHSLCPDESKFCRIERTTPKQSAEREWTRIAPMGGIINPRVIPSMKSTWNQSNQTDISLKETVIVPKRPVIPRDYEVNPRLKTMYHYHFNDSGDKILGFCDNRTIAERHAYFRSCERNSEDLLRSFKKGGRGNVRRYKSDYSRRISEYMAETSFIGEKILKSRIHDHSKCGLSQSRCVHHIDF